MAMRVAVYARVSTEAQEARGTIGSQIAALRERADAECHELVAEFVDDGKKNFVNFGMKGTVTSAIEIVRIWPDIFLGVLYPGRFVKPGIGL